MHCLINCLPLERPRLTHLDVCKARYSESAVHDAATALLAEKCPQLHHLSVDSRGVRDIGNRSAIARHCYNLRRLDISGCEGVINASICLVAKRCHELEELAMPS
eukprot:jgi/Mesvir1/5467/Mv15521-RA.1